MTDDERITRAAGAVAQGKAFLRLLEGSEVSKRAETIARQLQFMVEQVEALRGKL